MATTSLPTSGSYPVTLSPGLFPSTAKKRKRDEGEMIALKYAFKPGSMSSSTETVITSSSHGSKTLRADTASHGTQVFDMREEQSKARECVLIYDETTNTFSLHALPTTIHLTLDRTASSTSGRTRPSHSESPSASSTSSSSQPLAQKHRPEDTTTRPSTSRPTSQNKKPRQSEVALPDRPTKGGKALPPRPPPPSSAASPPKPTPAAPAPAPASGKGKGKNGAKKPPPPTKKSTTKKATPKAPIVPQGKYKSAEIIEDSDDEYDLGSATAKGTASQPPTVEVEEEDEFAKMLAEGLSEQQQQQQAYDDDEDEDDEDEEEDDEDDDELGGARLAVRQSAPSASGFGNGESEWL
ncbi:RNA polymerase II transcription elongation factor-domain-containing protein [Papiliotrema laurentii]|uniref:RNA polymerase II transcription elongation factor-domain-containing protein n=1 Tax=Papiliotrema laurentii TaxID=5418 RepID=A0AAD9L7I6_PAPLA|nr:RNA polymerase II transcription elongation factor-domain-containing protein [Papiliotrema laurentii]